MKSFNIVLIGCGRIGKMFADILLEEFPTVCIKAIVEDNLDQDWAKSRGFSNLLKKDQLQDILTDNTLDAAIIAASSSAHVELIKQVSKAGKHIFCEKPVAFTIDKIDEAILAVKKSGIKIQVGFNRRFDPDFARIKQSVVDGLIGIPHIIKITNRDPSRPDLKFIPRSGGLILDFNIHDFDMLRFISQSEVKEIFVNGAVLVDPKIGELNDIDTAIISLKLDNGAMCIIDCSREAVYGYDQRLEVFGSKGCLEAKNTSRTQTHLFTKNGVKTEKPFYSFVERYKNAYHLELKAFFDCLSTDAYPSVGLSDARAAVLIATAANDSLRTHKPVTLNN